MVDKKVKYCNVCQEPNKIENQVCDKCNYGTLFFTNEQDSIKDNPIKKDKFASKDNFDMPPTSDGIPQYFKVEVKSNVCPKCSAKNKEDSIFCIKCGINMNEYVNPLSEHKEPKCEMCNFEVQETMKFCPKCGAKINEGLFNNDFLNQNNETGTFAMSANNTLKNRTTFNGFGKQILFGVCALLIIAAGFAAKFYNAHSGNISSNDGNSSKGLTATLLFSDGNTSCTPSYRSGYEDCVISFNLKNESSQIVELSGGIYAVVDGKTYKADGSLSGSIDTYSDTFNPGDSKGSVVNFVVPKGSTITRVFSSPDGPNQSTATFILDLTLLAVDGSSTNNSNTDTNNSGILDRLNSMGTSSWVEGDTSGLKGTNALAFYSSETECAVWVFKSKNSAEDSHNMFPAFQKTQDAIGLASQEYWSFEDNDSGKGILFITLDSSTQCAQDVAATFNVTLN